MGRAKILAIPFPEDGESLTWRICRLRYLPERYLQAEYGENILEFIGNTSSTAKDASVLHVASDGMSNEIDQLVSIT
jgi:hypothetical protein